MFAALVFVFFFKLRQYSLVTGKINQGSPYRHVPKCAPPESRVVLFCFVFVFVGGHCFSRMGGGKEKKRKYAQAPIQRELFPPHT